MLKVINEQTQILATTAAPANGPGISCARGSMFSAQCNVTVNTPAAKLFASTAVNTGTSAVTITGHGFSTGLVGQLTTTSSLPTGLSTSTNYFIIVIDANTIQFASSLSNAQAGTFVALTGQGSGNDTFTPTALATCTVQLQKSNDGINYVNEGSAGSVSATGTFWLEKQNTTSAWMRVAYSLVSGSIQSSTFIFLQGDLD